MKFFFALGITFFLCAGSITAQTSYVVFLRDKQTSQVADFDPAELLSPRALARRQKMDIPLDMLDLPVSSNYLAQASALGIPVRGVSKWLNAFGTELTPEQLTVVEQQPYVSRVMLLKKVSTQNSYPTDKPTATDYNSSEYYGDAYTQNNLIKTTDLHRLNYTGRGMHIAVLDAGFFRVNDLPCFEALRKEHRILDKYDFVDRDTFHYDEGYHGMMVLSTMAAKQSNKFVGTAPDAFYYLYRTEDGGSESRLEELNWVLAAERADSIGVDLINSSLGYHDFDEPLTDYTHADLDGRTSIASLAAEIASSKGILVVLSAGNSGSDRWLRITAPADAHNVMTVGATYANGKATGFSSEGYTTDGRVKPDILAMGSGVLVQGSRGDLDLSDGTSFASPIMCGSLACLWQAFPDLSNLEVMRGARATAGNYTEPNTKDGYGLGNLAQAHSFLQNYSEAKLGRQALAMPIGFVEQTRIFTTLTKEIRGQRIELKSAASHPIETGFFIEQAANDELVLHNQNLKPGVYQAKITDNRGGGIGRTYFVVLPE